MHRRINFETFKKVAEWYGSDDFQIGTDDAGLTLRFGYWKKVNEDELLKIFGDHLFTLDTWECDDDDCGWLYSYILKPINPFA